MCFQAIKAMTIAHTALCPLTVSAMSFSWLSAGITITYTRSNGDRGLATVISVSECGQHVSIEYDAKGHCVSHPTAHRSHQELVPTIPKPIGIDSNYPQDIKNYTNHEEATRI